MLQSDEPVIRIGMWQNGGQTNWTLTTGSDGTSTEFMGSITDMSDGPNGNFPENWGSIVKTGAGTWTLGGYSTYNGSTTINQGGIVMNGTLAAAYNPTSGLTNVDHSVYVGNASGNAASLSGTGVI